MFTSQNMTVFGVVKDDQSCKETVKFSLVHCKPPLFFFKFKEILECFASKMHTVGTVILNDGAGSRGRQTELYYSVELPNQGEACAWLGESRMLPSSWAVEWALDREFMVMSTTWSQTLKSDILGWNPDSWLQVVGTALETRVFLLGPEWRLK